MLTYYIKKKVCMDLSTSNPIWKILEIFLQLQKLKRCSRLAQHGPVAKYVAVVNLSVFQCQNRIPIIKNVNIRLRMNLFLAPHYNLRGQLSSNEHRLFLTIWNLAEAMGRWREVSHSQRPSTPKKRQKLFAFSSTSFATCAGHELTWQRWIRPPA